MGGLSAGLAGANPIAGAQAAQNEALNNTGGHWGNRRGIVPSLHNPSEQAELDSQEDDVVRIGPGHTPTEQDEEHGDFPVELGGGRRWLARRRVVASVSTEEGHLT